MSVTGPKLQPTLFELSGSGRAAGRRIPAPPAAALDRLPAAARRAGVGREAGAVHLVHDRLGGVDDGHGIFLRDIDK